MPDDYRSLLDRFDDPPMTLRGVLGGLAILVALASLPGNSGIIATAFLDALPVAGFVVLAMGLVMLVVKRAARRAVPLRGLALGGAMLLIGLVASATLPI